MRLLSMLALTIALVFPAHAARKVAIVEILFLNPGQIAEEAEIFFAKAYEVGKRHGAQPIAGMKLNKWLHGGSKGIYNADFIVGSEFPNQEAMNTMLRDDKDYDKLLFEKDTLFDSSKTIIFSVDPMQSPE